MVDQTKKNNLRKTNFKTKKNIKGGGTGLGAMVSEGIQKATGQAERCNLAIDFYGKIETSMYTDAKLMEKIKKLEFIKNEPKLFKDIFTKKLKKFCIDTESKRYLKFCSNLLNCMKGPKLFYEILNDMYGVDKTFPLIKQLYKTKYKIDPSLTMDSFIKEEKTLRITTMAKFLIDVIFSSIKEYEKKHPPEKKIPIHALFLTDKLKELFKKISIDITFKDITEDKLTNIFVEKETAIVDYYQSRIMGDLSTQDSTENKDERSSAFIGIVAALILSIVVIETGIFDAPPGIGGGIT
jgi:hypothetical protein